MAVAPMAALVAGAAGRIPEGIPLSGDFAEATGLGFYRR